MGETEALESLSNFDTKLNFVFEYAICGDGYKRIYNGNNLSCPLAEQHDFDSAKNDQEI